MAESTRTPNRWTITPKTAIVLDLLRGGDIGELAHSHGLSQTQLCAWRDRFLEGGQAALRIRHGQIEREREHKVGQLTLEKELLTKTDALIRQRGRRLTG